MSGGIRLRTNLPESRIPFVSGTEVLSVESAASAGGGVGPGYPDGRFIPFRAGGIFLTRYPPKRSQKVSTFVVPHSPEWLWFSGFSCFRDGGQSRDGGQVYARRCGFLLNR